MKNYYQPEGNYFDKYNSTNLIIKYIMNNFFKNLDKLLKPIDFSSVLDAGCGEGVIADYVYNLKPKIKIEGMDISSKVIKKAKDQFPHIRFFTGTVLNINSKSDAYDLVIVCEVLEHIEKPEIALKEVFRVSKKYVLISVPNEPIWRISNLLRGRYLKSFGNTPGHIQHWSKRDIIRLLRKYGKILDIASPFPWTMVLCEKISREVDEHIQTKE